MNKGDGVPKTVETNRKDDTKEMGKLTEGSEGSNALAEASAAAKNAVVNSSTVTIDINALKKVAKQDVIYDYCVSECFPVTELATSIPENIWRKAKPFKSHKDFVEAFATIEMDWFHQTGNTLDKEDATITKISELIKIIITSHSTWSKTVLTKKLLLSFL